MLTELANHNDDVRRLLDKGYALRVDGSHLVIRDIPYLDSNGGVNTGAIVTNLVFIDRFRVKQDDHQIYFAGSVPHGLNGQPIPNLAGGPLSIPLSKTDVVVERSFSNKPKDGFTDFFEKIEHYVQVISGPAIAKFGVSPLTYQIDLETVNESVFEFHDTLTARAEIGDLAALFKDEIVAIIGLGGTGSYLLDFLAKTPVKEIRAFDGDAYHVHNAYRSPGKLHESELGEAKAVVYGQRYKGFHKGLITKQKYLDPTSANDLADVTFAFVCVDKGSARSEIFDLLMGLGIPFIDVGMGLNRKQGPLAGALRMTYYPPESAPKMRAMQLAEMTDEADNVYDRNIQIAELNALNAAIAIIRYKQHRGFYVDDGAPYHLLMDITSLKTFPGTNL